MKCPSTTELERVGFCGLLTTRLSLVRSRELNLGTLLTAVYQKLAA